MTFIHLTSTDGRSMVVRADQIDFMAEHTNSITAAQILDGGEPTHAYTDVVLRSGERGKCKETMNDILAQIEPTS